MPQDEEILKRNVCQLFNCTVADISHIEAFAPGLINRNYLFTYKGCRYVYRVPGDDGTGLVDRTNEASAQIYASKLGLDSSFVYEDATLGWKISRLVSTQEPFDYANDAHAQLALHALRRLHTSGCKVSYARDMYAALQGVAGKLTPENKAVVQPYLEKTATLEKFWRSGAKDDVLCHNDFYGSNILPTDTGVCIIDWEFAAMGDYGCDFASFITQADISLARASRFAGWYFGRKPTSDEWFHLVSSAAIVATFWYAWGLVYAQKNELQDTWLALWRTAAERYCEEGLRLLVEKGA